MSSQAVAWAIVHTAGGMSAKAVLLSLANYANEYGECWASQATIAEGAECSVRQARRILADLEQRGLIARERRGGAGTGRLPDMIRLRMRELPAILTARKRDETQPDNMAASPPDKVSSSLATGQVVRGATGQIGGGNRTTVSDNPNNPILTLEPPAQKPTRASKASKHPIPPDWQPSKALIERAAELGYSEREARFMGRQMVDHFEATGERRPGWDATFKTWVNRANPKQVRPAAAQWSGYVDAAELRRRQLIFEHDGTWRSEWGPIPTKTAGGNP